MENVIVTIDKEYYDQIDEYLRKTLGWDQYNESDYFEYIDFTFSIQDYKKVKRFLDQFQPDVMYEQDVVTLSKELKIGNAILEVGDKIEIIKESRDPFIIASELLELIIRHNVKNEEWVEYEVGVLDYLENGDDFARIRDKIEEYKNYLINAGVRFNVRENLKEVGSVVRAATAFINSVDNIFKPEAPSAAYGEFIIKQLLKAWELMFRDKSDFISGIKRSIDKY